MSRLRLLLDIPWAYPRPVTTAAVVAVAVSSTLVVRATLPPAARPPGVAPVVLASAGAYAAVRLGAHTAWTKRFKHDVVDRLGGDVDDSPTYLVAALGGGGVLVFLQLSRQAGARVSAWWRRP